MALNFTNPMTGDAFKEELEKALDTTTGGVIKGDIYKESQNDENKYVIQQEFHRELANIEGQCIIADANIQKINNNVNAINQKLGSYATKSALEGQYIVFDNRLLPLEEQAWETLAEISINQSSAQTTSVAFNVDAETLMNYTEIAIIAKSGFTLKSVASTAQGYASISVGTGQQIRCDSNTSGSPNYMSISNDVILVIAKWGVNMRNKDGVNDVKALFTPNIDVNEISVFTSASGCYVRGNIELRGRK